MNFSLSVNKSGFYSDSHMYIFIYIRIPGVIIVNASSHVAIQLHFVAKIIRQITGTG